MSPAALDAEASKLVANLATQSVKLAARMRLGSGSRGRLVGRSGGFSSRRICATPPRRAAGNLPAAFRSHFFAGHGGHRRRRPTLCWETRRGRGALCPGRKGDWSGAQLALIPATEHRGPATVSQSGARRMQSLWLLFFFIIFYFLQRLSCLPELWPPFL